MISWSDRWFFRSPSLCSIHFLRLVVQTIGFYESICTPWPITVNIWRVGLWILSLKIYHFMTEGFAPPPLQCRGCFKSHFLVFFRFFIFSNFEVLVSWNNRRCLDSMFPRSLGHPKWFLGKLVFHDFWSGRWYFWITITLFNSFSEAGGSNHRILWINMHLLADYC